MDATTRHQVRRRAGDACEYCGLSQEAVPIVGLTPTGRATTRLLAMNTVERIDLRAELSGSDEPF
jgi:hypothetical protein